MKKKVVILFPDVHLSYSPTVIGFYDLLSEHFDVTIIAPPPKRFDNKPINNRNVVYLVEKESPLKTRIFRFLNRTLSRFCSTSSRLFKLVTSLEVFSEYSQIKKYFREFSPDIVIAVDFRMLWFTERLGVCTEFLSLEIKENNQFYQLSNKKNIASVVIQTLNRYDYLFKDEQFKTFLVQNAPIYNAFHSHRQRSGLVFCGTAWNGFGFFHCLDFIKQFQDYSLTVRGALLNEDRKRIEIQYHEILTQNRLTIEDEYLDDSEVVDFLRQFRIGFCFYNFELDLINNFNYYSSPSGKMFKYFAAGVPVIAQDIAGMQPIKEFDCGVLIKNLEPQTIKTAVEKIESNFDYYSKNCLKAAEHYSFDKSAKPFIDYLLTK